MKYYKIFPALGLALFLAAFIVSLYTLGQIALGKLDLAMHWPWIITLITSAIGVLVIARDLSTIK